jgi:hypothetical protein
MPSTHLPDSICIPSRFVHQPSLLLDLQQQQQQQLDNVYLTEAAGASKSLDELVGYYCNSVEYLANFFLKYCTTLDSIGRILSLSSTVFYNTPATSNSMSNNNNSNNSQSLVLNSSFDMVTLGNCFDARRIHPLPIIETSLLKTLQGTSNFYMKPKTGYCALYKNENVILVMDSEPKTSKLSLAGM